MSNSLRNTLITVATFASTALVALAVNVAPAAAQFSSQPDGLNGRGSMVTLHGKVIGQDPDLGIRFQINRAGDAEEGNGGQ